MDVLEMVLPGTLLQQTDQQQSLRSSVLESKCSSKWSAVGCISTPRVARKTVHTSSPNAKSKESIKCHGSSQQPYDDVSDLSRYLSLDTSGANVTPRSSLDPKSLDKPVKKIKKKNRKKGRSCAKLSENVSAETGPTECAQDIATASQSSKEGGNEKDDIAIANGGGHSDLTGSRVLSDVWNSNNGDAIFSIRCSNGIKHGTEEPNTIEKKIIRHCSDCCSKDLGENISLTYVSQNKSYENDKINSCTFEGCNGGCTGTNKCTSQCTSYRDVHAVAPNECNNLISQVDIVNKPRYDHNIRTGKENGHSIWQKSSKSFRDAPTHWVKRSNIHVQKEVNLQEENILVKHNSFLSDALLSSHIVSAQHDITAQGVEEVVKNKQVMYCRTRSNAMAESSQWVAQRFHGGLNQYDSESGQDDIAGNTNWRKSKGTLNQSFKHKNINNRKQNVGGYKANVFKLQDRMIAPQKDALDVSRELHLCNKSVDAQRGINNNQRPKTDEPDGLHLYPTSANLGLNLPLTTISGVPGQALLPGVQSNNSVKISMVEEVLVGTPPTLLDNGQRDPARLDSNLRFEDNIRKDYTSQASFQKWIPIGAKNARMLENLGLIGACNEHKRNANSCKEKAEIHLEEYKIYGCESVATVVPGKTCLMSGHEIPTVMTRKGKIPQFDGICNKVEENRSKESVRDDVTSGNKAKRPPLLDIGSQSAVKALDAAYRLQMASESVQLATGIPLAEFERLVHSATPVIVPAFVQQDCNVCLGNQLSHSSLCKHQIPNIPLSAVWNWYEKPGNYGLEVKAQDFTNLKGFDIDSVSFKAHFVPFLSAVQLFGRMDLSRRSIQVQHNSEMQEIRDGEQCSSSSKTSMNKPCPGAVKPDHSKGEELSTPLLFKTGAEPVSSSDIFPAAGNDSLVLSSTSTCSDNMELIFEYFEHEQPQQRKPFYDKVMELVKAGSSSYQVFGDPSKLECMNLHDLHPASWYSVAWYPIYRIPEGNLHASFLTYHSLGHLFQRCSIDSHEKKQFSVISPVLGLQSYNAQGECWFCPKKPFEYSKGCTTFNSSEILKERLSTLEETALLFARGCIYKDHIKVTNRHPDYEFFLSRKR